MFELFFFDLPRGNQDTATEPRKAQQDSLDAHEHALQKVRADQLKYADRG